MAVLETWKVKDTSLAAARHLRPLDLFDCTSTAFSHLSKPAVKLLNDKKQESRVLQA